MIFFLQFYDFICISPVEKCIDILLRKFQKRKQGVESCSLDCSS